MPGRDTVDDLLPRLISGAAAGGLATAPMTAAMLAIDRLLPPAERYPLPPAEITAKMAGQVPGGQSPLGEAPLIPTLLAHFGYGAATGAIYEPLWGWLRWPDLVAGNVFGLTVWTVSYLGWVPALGILSPATDHPRRRAELMIAAHVVWGSSLALIARPLRRGG